MEGYGEESSPKRKEAAEFQKSPMRGRPMVNKLVPKKLTRSTTDDTQTAINRVVHEALARHGQNSELAEDVKQRVQLVIQAKEDELRGRITHLQRLELIRLTATLSVDEVMQELSRMQQSVSQDAEKKLQSESVSPSIPSIWRRLLCTEILPQSDVLTLAVCCRFLRQDHALGLHTLTLPSHFDDEDTTLLPLSLKPHRMDTQNSQDHGFQRLLYKFRYVQNLSAGRGWRLHDADFEQLKISQLRRLDLSFCRNVSAEKLLKALGSTFCLQELCLRGCTQISSPSFEETLESITSLTYLDLRGCWQVQGDSIAVKQLRSLRMGFECQEELWEPGYMPPAKELTLSWDLASLNLRFVELDLGVADKVTEERMQSLLSLKCLDSLMLWNPRFSQKIFRSIVARFSERVDAFTLEDCYHEQESYFHVVPSTWELRDRCSVEAFSAQAFLPAPSARRRILAAVNVTREPVEQIQAMVSPVVEMCQLEDVLIIDEYTEVPIPSLASPRLRRLELCFTHNTPPDYLQDFLGPFLKNSPELKVLRFQLPCRYCPRSFARLYQELLDLVAQCENLEELEFLVDPPHMWEGTEQKHPVAEYYDSHSPLTKCEAVATISSIEKLLQSRRWRRFNLLPPCRDAACRLRYWRLLRSFHLPVDFLLLRDSDAELQDEAAEILHGARISVSLEVRGSDVGMEQMGQAMLTADMIRSLELDVNYRGASDSFWHLLEMLPQHSPRLEELLVAWRPACETVIPEEQLRQDRLRRFLSSFEHLKVLYLGPLQMPLPIPELVQRNARSLQALHLTGVDAKTLLSAIGRCSNLESLIVKPSSPTTKACLDFTGTCAEFGLKVIVRCPRLKHLDIEMADSEDADTEKVVRCTMQIARNLQNWSYHNVDLYRGLCYNDGYTNSENAGSGSSESDSDA